MKNSISKKIKIIVIVLLLGLTACIKDDVMDDSCFCVPIPYWEGTGFGYVYLTENPQFVNPSFNPNSDDEFLYVRLDYSIGEPEIYTYNFETQSANHIFTGSLWSKPEWGKKNWILFQRPDQNIWKIKSNGDSLTQLTFQGGCFFPKWNNTGDTIIYQNSFGGNTAVLMTENGLILDTLINSVGATSSWNHPKYVGGITFNNIYYYSPMEDIRNVIYEFEEQIPRRGSVWIGDELFYSEDAGVFKIGIDDSSPTLLRTSCNAIKYFYPSINYSNDKLLWVHSDQFLIHTDTVRVKTNIASMDVNGENMQILNLP